MQWVAARARICVGRGCGSQHVGTGRLRRIVEYGHSSPNEDGAGNQSISDYAKGRACPPENDARGFTVRDCIRALFNVLARFHIAAHTCL